MKHWLPRWIFPVIIALSALTVWLRLSIVKTTYSVSQTEKMIRNAKLEREQAKIRLASLRSPRRLEILSKTKFKLEQPRSEQVVYLK